MKTVEVSKANDSKVQSCLILLNQSIPNFHDDDRKEKLIAFFEREASVIVYALETHLPSGTFDAVLRELLSRKASRLMTPIGF